MRQLPSGPREPNQELTSAASGRGMLAAPLPVGDMPGPGLKRDYAGVLEYWQMVRRHKGAVLLTTFLSGLIGFLLTLPELRIYQARTTLEIQGLNEDFLNMRNVNPTVNATSSYYPEYDIQTQVRILQSKSLIKRVREKVQARKRIAVPSPDRLSAWRKTLHLSPPTADELWRQALGIAAGSLKVKSSGMNRIVEVTSDSTSPQLAADFLNTLAQEYIEQNLEARWQSTEHTGEWLTKQLQDLKIKLEKAEEQLQYYARATGLVITSEKTNVDESKLGDVQKELSTAQADRMAKQSRYEMAKSSAPDALPDVLDDSSLQDSQKTLSDLRRQLAQQRVAFTPNHPEVRRVQAQISMLESTLEKERANILTRIRNDYEAALRREKLLAASYGSQARLVSDQAAKTSHYNLLKREVDATRLLYETMLQKLKEASIASALRATNIRVVDAADPPSAPYKPDISRNTIMGLLTGIFLGVVGVVLRERADRTLQDPGDISFYLKLPELGVVPAGNLEATPHGLRHIPASAGAGRNGVENPADTDESEDRLELVTWKRKSSLLAESFRTTLTSILFSGHNGDRPRILVLTSASPKEGKTTVVSNLSIALAEINQRVLVIDGDMRRPRLHKVFNLENTRGLSDLLRERSPLASASLEEAVCPTSVPGLFLLASGTSRFSVSSLLHSERLPELMNLARTRFDTVVIDTPPMVNISDARVIARHSDALILVLRSAVTTRDAALLAKQRFAEDGIPVLGTILNGWNPNTPGYGYYRYYYAGYYHYYGNTNGNES